MFSGNVPLCCQGKPHAIWFYHRWVIYMYHHSTISVSKKKVNNELVKVTAIAIQGFKQTIYTTIWIWSHFIITEKLIVTQQELGSQTIYQILLICSSPIFNTAECLVKHVTAFFITYRLLYITLNWSSWSWHYLINRFYFTSTNRLKRGKKYQFGINNFKFKIKFNTISSTAAQL